MSKPRPILRTFAERLAPWLVAALALGAWEFLVGYYHVKPFVLPAPSGIAQALIDNRDVLLNSGWITFEITVLAFAAALIAGVALAMLFTQSRMIEAALLPYAITLQVTPVVAIAPLIIIWVGIDRPQLAVLILATIVAFFPILANMTLGLRSADANLKDLFRLYGATRWQTLTRLQIPTALPYLLAGMKISGGLALIGTIVAEFVASTGASSGLAWRIIEAGNRLETAKLFAALLLLSLLGIAIYVSLSALERLVLRRWHESASIDPRGAQP